MPRVEAAVDVDVPPALAFAVSQTSGEARLRWDPFIHSQRHLDGATVPAKGVRSETRSRHGLRMVSEYVSFSPPDRVGMRMIDGPWFFERFGGGWAFEAVGAGRTRATWRYTFTVRPSWLAPVADPIGRWLLGRDIRRRITGFAQGCRDEVVLDAARALQTQWEGGGPTG